MPNSRTVLLLSTLQYSITFLHHRHSINCLRRKLHTTLSHPKYLRGVKTLNKIIPSKINGQTQSEMLMSNERNQHETNYALLSHIEGDCTAVCYGEIGLLINTVLKTLGPPGDILLIWGKRMVF